METQQNPPPLPTLPAQLMLAMGTWLASPFALACANNGLPPWSKELKNLPRGPAAQAKLFNAINAEARNRASSLLTGVLRYMDAPYARNVPDKPVIWQRGNARLLDYSQQVKPDSPARAVTLFVPSLINRYYILDLDEERSLLNHLAAQGVYTLVLDWGAPGEFERAFDCKRYVTDIFLPALEFVHRTSGRQVTLAGYCMGGILALAAAQLKPKQVAGLALLATPWDFHCPNFAPFVVGKEWHTAMESQIASQETLPAEIIQSLFYWTDPWVFEQKFRRFANLSPESQAAKEFIALEHWVNDGVPMTAAVARECLIGWAQRNELARGIWQVAGKTIDPGTLSLPAFIAIPRNDHVVPYECALPLANAMPQATVIKPAAGHVGMVVGARAREELWAPLAMWMKQ